MHRYLLITIDGPVATVFAASYEEANAIAITDRGPFGWALQPYGKPYGPFAPADRPRDREQVYCELARDWRLREVVDLGPGTYYRYRVSGQNMNVAPGGYGFDFSWDVPSVDDALYDLDHAQRFAMARWVVRARLDAKPWAPAYECTLKVQAYHEASARWAACWALRTRVGEITVLDAAPEAMRPADTASRAAA